MTHKIEILHITQVTPDTKVYVCSRPKNYKFTSGQATDVTIDSDGWQEEARPFTFTCDPGSDILSFTIKSYFDHDGVTKKLWSLGAGDGLLIGDPWGAIAPSGPGVFLAGGAGITPFIPIFEALAKDRALTGSTLIFANSTYRDIILRDHFEALEGLETVFVTKNGDNADRAGRLDGDLLSALIPDYDSRFYVCGPPAMEETLVGHLHAKGVTDYRIIREEG
ncbi:MAG: flavodoxin reductase [Pseudomonadota bacterium]